MEVHESTKGERVRRTRIGAGLGIQGVSIALVMSYSNIQPITELNERLIGARAPWQAVRPLLTSPAVWPNRRPCGTGGS
jgi:hypothetical protein